MKEIMLKAPEGYEFASEEPRPPKAGEWYLSLPGKMTHRAICDYDYDKYILRKLPKYKTPEREDFGMFSNSEDFRTTANYLVGWLDDIVTGDLPYIAEDGSEWKYFKACRPIEFIEEQE